MTDHEDRLAKQYRRLGTSNPVCVTCAESDPFCLELHHLAGRKHHDDLAIVCRNCHRKLTEQQKDHVPEGQTESRGALETSGHYLLGLADLLVMVAKALREFGAKLLAHGSARYHMYGGFSFHLTPRREHPRVRVKLSTPSEI